MICILTLMEESFKDLKVILREMIKKEMMEKEIRMIKKIRKLHLETGMHSRSA